MTLTAEQRARALIISFCRDQYNISGEYAITSDHQERLIPLITAEIVAAEAEARRAALEEAARTCDERSAWAEDKITDEHDDLFANYSNACDDCADLIRALASTPADASPWREIASAPKDGTLILIAWAGSDFYPVISRWLKNAQAWTHPFNKPVNPPTHWMPLPSPPASENNNV